MASVPSGMTRYFIFSPGGGEGGAGADGGLGENICLMSEAASLKAARPSFEIETSPPLWLLRLPLLQTRRHFLCRRRRIVSFVQSDDLPVFGGSNPCNSPVSHRLSHAPCSTDPANPTATRGRDEGDFTPARSMRRPRAGRGCSIRRKLLPKRAV
jgi:hypothetical protein